MSTRWYEPTALIPGTRATAEQVNAENDKIAAAFERFPSGKGDPGGNVLAIGLFVEADGMEIPAGTDLVQTTGHSVLGEGPALYVFDPASTAMPTDRANLLASPNNLAAAPWSSGVPATGTTAQTVGDYTRLTDTGAGFQRWEQTVPFNAPVGTVECRVKKDEVPPSIRKAILRIRFEGAVARQYDVLIDTLSGTVTDGSQHSKATSPPMHMGLIDDVEAGEWIIWVTGAAPVGTNKALIRLYPANGPGNGSVSAAAGFIDVRNGSAKLYIGVHETYVPTNNAVTAFTAADGRVFRLSPDQVLRPQHLGVSIALLDNTETYQRFLDFVTKNRCREVDISCDIAVSAPLLMGPTNASRVFTGRATIRALTALPQIITFRNQQDVVWNAWTDYYGPGASDWAARTCFYGEVFDNCRGFNRAGGGAYYSGFIYSGFSAHLGNNNFINWGDCKGFYCGSGGPDEGISLRTPFTFVAHSSDATADNVGQQFTRVAVDAMPEEAVWSRCGDMVVWHFGLNRPFIVRARTRVADNPEAPNARRGGTLDLFPWVDTRTITADTLEFMFGGLGALSGGNCNETTGRFEAQLSCCAVENGALYGSKFERVSAQHCGYAAKIGTRLFGVHQPTDLGMVYNEVCRANIIMPNSVAGDHGRVRAGMQHAFNADENWSFKPFHDRVNYQPTPVQGFRGSVLNYQHTPCLYEKVDPAAWRKLSDALLLTPNFGAAYIAETGVTNRSIVIEPLNPFQRSNLGYSGGRYEARGSGPGGAPTGTITFFPLPDSGLKINGLDSVSFSNFDGAALFSFEWNPADNGYLVHLLAGRGPDVYGQVFEARVLAAGEVFQPAPVTVAGAVPGDFVDASLSPNPNGARVEAWVSAANSISARVSNPTATPMNLSAGTVRLRIRKA